MLYQSYTSFLVIKYFKSWVPAKAALEQTSRETGSDLCAPAVMASADAAGVLWRIVPTFFFVLHKAFLSYSCSALSSSITPPSPFLCLLQKSPEDL